MNVKVTVQAEHGNWKRLGPGGGGAHYIPTLSPHDTDTALTSCDMTGAYITHDGGESWEQLNFKRWTQAFAFDPVRPRVAYAGASGLYQTKDGGRAWDLLFPHPQKEAEEKMQGDHGDHFFMPKGSWPGGLVEAIAVDPSDYRTLFLGISTKNGLAVYASHDEGATWGGIGYVGGSAFKGLYVQERELCGGAAVLIVTDEGLWKAETAGGEGAAIRKLGLPGKAGDAWRIRAASRGRHSKTGEVLVYVVGDSRWEEGRFCPGIAVYSEKEDKWREPSGTPDLELKDAELRSFSAVAVCAEKAEVIYLGAAEPVKHDRDCPVFGVLKSEDGGATWKWSLRIEKDNPDNRETGWVERDYDTDWGGGPFFLTVHSSNPELCYATDWGTAYKTGNGGRTWEQLYTRLRPGGSWAGRGLDVTNVYGVYFDPFDPKHQALSCTDVGLFHSCDSGESYRHALAGVSGDYVNTCYWLVFDPEVRGRAWSVWSGCHDMPRAKMFKENWQRKYRGGLLISEDGLESWKPLWETGELGGVPVHLVLDPESPVQERTLYAAVMGLGVLKSTDGGKSFALFEKGLENHKNAWRLTLLAGKVLYLVCAAGYEKGERQPGGLFVSWDGGAQWRGLSLPAEVHAPNHLAVDPADPKRLLLSCWPWLTAGEERGGGALLSEDGGESWKRIYSQDAHVYAGAFLEGGRLLLSAFEGRVVLSGDDGKSWKPLPGFDFKWPKEIFPDPYDKDAVYIATYGSSLWRGTVGEP